MLTARLWDRPYYNFKDHAGKKRVIDVTSSVSPGLPPNELTDQMIDLFARKGVEQIVDFGAGALRHTIPFLQAGFSGVRCRIRRGF